MRRGAKGRWRVRAGRKGRWGVRQREARCGVTQGKQAAGCACGHCTPSCQPRILLHSPQNQPTHRTLPSPGRFTSVTPSSVPPMQLMLVPNHGPSTDPSPHLALVRPLHKLHAQLLKPLAGVRHAGDHQADVACKQWAGRQGAGREWRIGNLGCGFATSTAQHTWCCAGREAAPCATQRSREGWSKV